MRNSNNNTSEKMGSENNNTIKTKSRMNTFNNYFGITDKSSSHLDILLDNDIEVFIDPYHIANNRFNSEIARDVYFRIKSFFETLNTKYVLPKKRKEGIRFLSTLKEANEYHLGYSFKNKGKGVGSIKAKAIFDSLSKNGFIQQGITITNEAHNVLLLVEGIGQDNMSDILANVCRDIFAEYTFKQCQKYGVNTSLFSVKFYNDITQKWEIKEVQLPSYKGQKIILIPQFLASKTLVYPNRYNWLVSKEYISSDILKGKIDTIDRSKFVVKLKNGSEKCITKEINKCFKKKKGKLIEFETEYNGSLDRFMEHVKDTYLPVSNEELSNLQNKAS